MLKKIISSLSNWSCTKYGVKGVNVAKEHEKVLKKVGIKRELVLDGEY